MIFEKINHVYRTAIFALVIVSGVSLAYSVDAVYAASDDGSSSTTMMMTMTDAAKKMQTLSPLAQHKSGIFLSAIECNNPNNLYIRDASSPVCIRDSTYERLLERGMELVPYDESAVANEMRTVTIGLLAPLTGGAFGYGQDISAGSEAALSDFNTFLEERGEIWRLNLQSYDTMTDGSLLLGQLVDLNNQGINIVAGPSIDIFDYQLVEYANANDMLLFSCCSAVLSPAVPDDALFRLVPNHNNHGHKIAEVMSDTGIKVLIAVGRDAPWITDLIDSTTTKLVELGGQSTGPPILYSVLGEFDSSHTQMLADVVSADLEASDVSDIGIMYVGFEETFDFLELASSHAVLSDVRWFGADANTILHDNQNGLVFAEQVEFTSIQPTVPDSDLKTRLTQQISEKLGRTPSAYAFIEYDLIQLLGHTILATQSTSTAEITKRIPTIAQEYVGVSGPIMFDDAGDRSDIEYAVWNIRNGVWVDDLSTLSLTAQERAWLASNPEIKVAPIPDWAPFECIKDDGTLGGITPQFISAFEDLTDADFVPVTDIASWSEVLDRLEARTADIGFFIVDTPERRDYLGFTTPYRTVTIDIVTAGDIGVTLDTLGDFRVATIKEFEIDGWFAENYPGAHHVSVDSMQSGLEMLQSGQVDAFLESWDVASYTADTLGIAGLYNAGSTGYGFDLSIAYRSDQPVLGSILQKALDAVPDTTFVLPQPVN